MKEPANDIRSGAEKDCRRQPAGRQNGVNHTMKKQLLFVGLDVHAQSITIALADGGGGEARSTAS